jgi:transcriptional regulator with XRE-family HTH domain
MIYSPLNLEKTRKKYDLNQREAAQAFGVTLRTFQRWESGEIFPSEKKVEDFENILKSKGEQMGKMSRTKGHSFERWVAIQFRSIYPEAKRKLEYQKGECIGIDLDNVGPYLVQCKRGKKYASLSAIDEVEVDPIEGGVRVLVTKGDNKEALACISLDHFLHLVKNQK